MKFSRSSGILLHPTSLPGRFGIGGLGDEAYQFADFLVAAGQSLWQVLPLTPTGYGNSPYACDSAFAGNTLLIDPVRLYEDELLSLPDLDQLFFPSNEKVDFEPVRQAKQAMLHKAFAAFQRTTSDVRNACEAFAEQNACWLDDYVLFRALKQAHSGRAWYEWDEGLAWRQPAALADARLKLKGEIEAERFFQFLFFKQWFALKRYCNDRGIKIIGDIPMFVAHDSVDVWTNPQEFKLDRKGLPAVVAGVPPDYFSETGQFWGNPIYDWERMAGDGFAWWVERVRRTLETVDIARIDHFRGFVACWEIPQGDRTAERGRWVEAPGRELFTAARNALGQPAIIAEDLGLITPEVEELRDEFGFPGMRVLQFAFSGAGDNINLPHNYQRNVVAYTGTHDNDTTIGWFSSPSTTEKATAERDCALKYLSTTGKEINWDFIRAVWASVADTAIVPFQDVLGLGSEARMNLPNSEAGNWSWRARDGCFTESLANRLREMSETYGRIAQSKTAR